MIEVVTDKGSIVSVSGKEPFVLTISSTEITLESGIDLVTLPLVLPIGKPTVTSKDPRQPPTQADWRVDPDGYFRTTFSGKDLAAWSDESGFHWQVRDPSGTAIDGTAKDIDEACRTAEASIALVE